MNGMNRSQWKQWLAAMSASLAMIIVGNEEFWIFHTLRTVAEPAMMSDVNFVWTRLSIAATGSVIGAILGAVLADKYGRKKTLLAISILPIIQIVCSYSISTQSLWSCVPLFFGEIGLGMTCVVVPLYISEVPFFYVGKSIAVGTGLLELCLVSVIIVGIFVGAFAWLPETPYYLASKKRYDAAGKSLAFYRSTDTVMAQNGVQMIVEEVEAKDHASGRPCCQKIRQLVRGSNAKGLIIIILLIIAKWSEQKLDARNDLIDVVSAGSLVSKTHQAKMIAHLVSLIASILIVSTIDVIGRRSFLLSATFISFVTVIVTLICGRSNEPRWLFNGIDVILHFCQLIILSIPLVYVGELFSMNVKALAISIVTIFNLLISYSILYFDFIEVNANSYIIGVALLFAFPITFAFIPETKKKALSDIQSEVATTTCHCKWLKNKLCHTNQPAEIVKK